jgi:hypothetical protein
LNNDFPPSVSQGTKIISNKKFTNKKPQKGHYFPSSTSFFSIHSYSVTVFYASRIFLGLPFRPVPFNTPFAGGTYGMLRHLIPR